MAIRLASSCVSGADQLICARAVVRHDGEAGCTRSNTSASLSALERVGLPTAGWRRCQRRCDRGGLRRYSRGMRAPRLVFAIALAAAAVPACGRSSSPRATELSVEDAGHKLVDRTWIDVMPKDKH